VSSPPRGRSPASDLLLLVLRLFLAAHTRYLVFSFSSSFSSSFLFIGVFSFVLSLFVFLFFLLLLTDYRDKLKPLCSRTFAAENSTLRELVARQKAELDELRLAVAQVGGTRLSSLSVTELTQLEEEVRRGADRIHREVLLRREHQRQREREERMREAESSTPECIVCMDHAIDTLCLPCAHLVICGLCARQILKASGRCPTCREQIKQIVKVYQK
jgi:Zinc finger, C3HC4 type (RING finger)